MKIRGRHVSVRRGVRKHPQWRREQPGEPISQSEMGLTLIAGSAAPGLGLWAVGYLTTRSEMVAALHFCRYLGYLLGVRCDDIFPETVADAVRILYHFDATRAYDGGKASRELVESFVPSFTPNPGSSPAIGSGDCSTCNYRQVSRDRPCCRATASSTGFPTAGLALRRWEPWIYWQSGTHTHRFRDLSAMRR